MMKNLIINEIFSKRSLYDELSGENEGKTSGLILKKSIDKLKKYLL